MFFRSTEGLIIIIISTVIFITYIQDIYNYMPENTMFIGYIMLQLLCGYGVRFM
jgi:hypothetical protein